MTSSLLPADRSQTTGSVVCLGRTFKDEAERLAYYRNALLADFSSPDSKQHPGFPAGEEDVLIELSDPPYFTPCPNPFLTEVISHFRKTAPADDVYARDPFAADVSEGRGDTLYNAHGYHTKVPHQALMRYILHYTAPNDIVLDGFCGTGGTGLAAMLCADRIAVESLGYQVDAAGTIRDSGGNTISQLGYRTAILSDLSPIACFIAANYSTPQKPAAFSSACRAALAAIESCLGWMLCTLHNPRPKDMDVALKTLSSSQFAEELRTVANGRVHYTVWSDVFSCQQCGTHLTYWTEAVDIDNGKVRDSFPCPTCKVSLSKRSLDRVWDSYFDPWLGRVEKIAKAVPVRINYTIGGKTCEKAPDKFDIALLAKIRGLKSVPPFPTDEIEKGDKTGDPFAVGIHHVHQYFTARNLWLLGTLWNAAELSAMKWAITGIMQRASRQHQIAVTRIGGEKVSKGGATAGHRRGTLYIPSNQVEFNPLDLFAERVKTMTQGFQRTADLERRVFVSVNSAHSIKLPDQSIDYIFVDPPFGGNIMYSELNYAWEALLGAVTNTQHEAIQNTSQQKRLPEYQALMTGCFQEFFRVLKPGRWMTVEFHNSKHVVWNAIQESLLRAGFVVADVRVLDKQLKTHTQRTAAGSVNKDLVITAYRPSQELEARFSLDTGTQEGVWEFVQEHLRKLPVLVKHAGKPVMIPERQKCLLYDRMLAFHIERGVAIPLDAAEFYLGLRQRFPERDGLYFLADQVADYDRQRLQGVHAAKAVRD
ncbi:MAG: DNA methyltransferase [Planctomycetota bacterium]|nr:DNA methyltransferase [Planctomycetota bacterium]